MWCWGGTERGEPLDERDDASTATSDASEERSESQPSSGSGLSRSASGDPENAEAFRPQQQLLSNQTLPFLAPTPFWACPQYDGP